ncbi:uncharacterized protein STEHIDRAFT_145330 [Stereum hirsutum FP-91666 SS1]|uniref:uncharacterized protein n=1 Tax=Stereum hirsutum (strain FP-91666) TaxID=721885 RepID=UPI000440F2AA|nr:uncharacterized protein STEHIDRAFT_145330 [Stereum hirsutum FP-91666 SS1]EIM90200.1 hypothetical protein STEHIDRAFT_145330 [Stereum hirsutum FP-91666 SS1]
MDFIFCLPILFGCPTKIKPDGDQTPRVCPRCHNVSVIRAKSRTWFELCFIPLIPMTSKHIWVCSICQWSVPLQQGWEPQLPGGGGYYHQQPQQPNYQPAYFHNQPPPPK